ncbi:transporter substrate-binding domain-containing protein [Bacillus sp. JJ722]|uniref:transporter substrate-binding domain-containing protein n=1 Tax=Bacillus sp. JJ722 TaxID=3122973 RepID=UPI003000569E
MKRLSFVVALALLVFSLVGCGNSNTTSSGSGDSNSDKNENKKDVVIFATTPDGGAFSAKDKDGKLVGFDIEIVETLAKKENLQVEWKEMKFNGIIPALQAKQIDGAAAAITIRDDRRKVTNFTDSYFESGLVLVTKKDSSIKSFEDLKGKTIVAKQGSSGLQKAQELAKKYDSNVKVLEDEPTLYMDVEAGGSDALVNDLPFVLDKMNSGTGNKLKMIGDKLTGEEYGIAISKDNEDLLNKFNKHLAEMKSNGEYDKMYKKYFGSN